MSQREVWDSLAESWSRLRKKPQEAVEEFLSDKSGLILDVGCGAGRNLIPGKDYIGMDFSLKLLKFAGEHAETNGINASFVMASTSGIPFKDSSFANVMMAAVLHVIPGDKRIDCINEISRVLKPGGYALITVWNKNQPRFFFSRKEKLVPWKLNDETVMRYYYLFTKGEMRKFLEKNGFEIISIRGSRKKAFKLFPMDIIAVARKR